MKQYYYTSPSKNESKKEYKRSRDECSYDSYNTFLDKTRSKRNNTTIDYFKTTSSSIGNPVAILHRGKDVECDIKGYRKTYHSVPNVSPCSTLPKNSSQGKESFDSSTLMSFSEAKINVSKYSTSSATNLPPSYPRKGYGLATAQPKIDFEYSSAGAGGLVGLKNLGNTCFMNTILQCLFHCGSIAQYFTQGVEEIHINSQSPMKGKLAISFSILCQEIYHPDNHLSSVKPILFKNAITNMAAQFDGIEQQDAHELLRFLLDGLDEDMKFNEREDIVSKSLSEDQLEMLKPVEQGDYFWSKHVSKNSSFITDAFCGQFRSTVTCTVCGHKSYCFDPFYDLSLPIPNDSFGSSFRRRLNNNSTRSPPVCTLYDCLESFVNDEALSKANKTYCKLCEKRQTCRKSLKIERAPSILVLHLKRFNNSRRKKNGIVSFPPSALDLSTFLSLDEYHPSNTKPVLYDLSAVCHHSGSLNSGHYVASCLEHDSGKWYNFDDALVSELPENHPTNLCNSPYILFYEQRISET